MHVSEVQQVFNQPTILIVEDQITQRKLLVKLMEKWFADHYLLVEASNGQEAIDFFKLNRRSIHLITMNIQMPKVDGLQAIGHIRELEGWSNERYPVRVPIVVISTAIERFRGQLTALKCNALVPVPYESTVLSAIIKNTLQHYK